MAPFYVVPVNFSIEQILRFKYIHVCFVYRNCVIKPNTLRRCYAISMSVGGKPNVESSAERRLWVADRGVIDE